MNRDGNAQVVRTNSRISWLNMIVTGLLLGLVALAWGLTWSGTLSSVWQRTLLTQSGQFAYLLLTFTTTTGPLIGTTFAPKWLNAANKTGWHGIASGFSLVVASVHGLFSLLGNNALTVPEVLVPGLASFRTVPMAAGTLGLWLMLLVYVTFALRNRIGIKAARALHLLAYPAFIASTLHPILLNPDHLEPMYVIGAIAVGLALAVRLWTLTHPKGVLVQASDSKAH
jgi:methionine sulfoxide reductase heme-binding subunit